MRAKWLPFLLSHSFDRARSAEKSLLQRHNLPFTLHPGGQRVILVAIPNYSSLRGRDAMVAHLADKTSASTTSAANSMLATSENVACNGCAWKCRPRSVRVRMASLLPRRTGLLNTSSRPCDTNSLFKLDSKSTKIAVITGPSRGRGYRLPRNQPIACCGFFFENSRKRV